MGGLRTSVPGSYNPNLAAQSLGTSVFREVFQPNSREKKLSGKMQLKATTGTVLPAKAQRVKYPAELALITNQP